MTMQILIRFSHALTTAITRCMTCASSSFMLRVAKTAEVKQFGTALTISITSSQTRVNFMPMRKYATRRSTLSLIQKPVRPQQTTRKNQSMVSDNLPHAIAPTTMSILSSLSKSVNLIIKNVQTKRKF